MSILLAGDPTVVNSLTNSYSRDGVLSSSGSSGWPDWVVNRGRQFYVSDPYSYDDAVTYALALLKQIDLLNPDKTYPVIHTQGAYVGQPAVTTHFCYTVENANYPGAACVNRLMVGPDVNGNIVFSAEGYTHTDPSNSFAYQGDFTGNPGAWNGYMTSSLHTYGGGSSSTVLDGFVMVKKQAWRNPSNYTRRVDNLDPFAATPFGTVWLVPKVIDAGDNIFLPTDVPGYGWSKWDNGALPGLTSP